MPLDNAQGGFGYAGEFQSAALPWVTSSVAPAAGSPTEYPFAFVTRFVSVTNLDSTKTMSIGFTRNGITKTSNKVIVPPLATLQFEWRVKSVFVQGESASGGAFNLSVGLTTILTRNMPQLSGTLDDGTAGFPGVG
jgi:hypothetical protein